MTEFSFVPIIDEPVFGGGGGERYIFKSLVLTFNQNRSRQLWEKSNFGLILSYYKNLKL